MQRKEIEDRMEYLLDDIISPSLEAKSSLKYIGLVQVMSRSDDSVLKDVASKLAINLHSWLQWLYTPIVQLLVLVIFTHVMLYTTLLL